MVSCSMTFALYLAITLESTDFNTTQTDLGNNIFLKTRYMFLVLMWALDAWNKKKRIVGIFKFQKSPLTISLVYILLDQ